MCKILTYNKNIARHSKSPDDNFVGVYLCAKNAQYDKTGHFPKWK